MKTFNFLLAFTAAALLFAAGISTADEMKATGQSATFDIGDGEGNILGEVSFPASDNEEAQAESTCAMTPNAPGLPVTTEIPNETPHVETPYYTPDISNSPVSNRTSLNTRTPPRPGNPYNPYPPQVPPTGPGEPPAPPTPPITTVPEPGTMLILGMGLCAVSAARVLRRRKK